MKMRVAIAGSLLVAALVTWAATAMESVPTMNCADQKSIWCIAPRTLSSLDAIHGATVPKLATPDWFTPATPITKTVTYTVTTKGAVTANMDEFRTFAAATLNDARGWARLGVAFERVDSGGDFTLYLSEASQLPSYDPICDTYLSCSVGRNVVINQDRWAGGTPAWSNGGGDLTGYRQYVINHEVGHWLGHGHRSCAAAGQPSPLMQQQSVMLGGCTPNPWPLQSEMYSPKLGIRS